MGCFIVVEGKADSELLERVLRAEVEGGVVRVTDGGGKSGAASLARTLVGSRHDPVVLVIDADTTEQSAVAEQRAHHEARLRLAGANGRARVVMAEPVLEVCVFQAASVLPDLLGVTPTEAQSIRAQYVPCEVLTELVPSSDPTKPLRRIVAELRPKHVQELRQTPLIQEILQAIADLTKQQAA